MKFLTFGPFPVPLTITNKSDELAKVFEQAKIGLNHASGVYIFVRHEGKKLIPVYVGETHGDSFGGRLASHLNLKTNPALCAFLGDSSADVSLFLIAVVNASEQFLIAKKDKGKAVHSIAALEKLLIGSCLEINPDIFNRKDVQFYRNISVPGYLNSKPESRDDAARALAKMLEKKES